MKTKGPIYQMMEQEIEKLYAGYFNEEEIAGIFLSKILPKIQELEPTWISVEERLPESYQRVLIFNKKWGTDGYKVAQFISWAGGQFTEGSILRKPTHWQPLTLPPTK